MDKVGVVRVCGGGDGVVGYSSTTLVEPSVHTAILRGRVAVMN